MCKMFSCPANHTLDLVKVANFILSRGGESWSTDDILEKFFFERDRIK